jgi:hypothetical protein
MGAQHTKTSSPNEASAAVCTKPDPMLPELTSIKDRPDDWRIMNLHIRKMMLDHAQMRDERSGTTLITVITRTVPMETVLSTTQDHAQTCPIPCCHCRISVGICRYGGIP